MGILEHEVDEAPKLAESEDESLASAGLPLINVSGLYATRVRYGTLEADQLEPELAMPPVEMDDRGMPGSNGIPRAEFDDEEGFWGFLPLPRTQLTLRLDVDGRYPQSTASGTLRVGFVSSTHWIARLRQRAADYWVGSIWYRRGALSIFPYSTVQIRVNRSSRRARVRFSVNGRGPARSITVPYRSPYFHPIHLEFDTAKGTQPVTWISTHAHPNRPGTLRNERLTIPKVFQRAGFDVRTSGQGIVPVTDGPWSDQEMHDAMQVHWSRYMDRAQWAVWTFFASLHESGTSLGGIMFDDIGPNHRQGTAIFNDSFIKNPPAADPEPDAWVQRMRFWTAVHEMGHTFNLAHSWQKSLGTPWIPLADEPGASSFMNYPYRVSGGESAFFSEFEYRFSNSELLFMRHAPETFVQQGNADWFDHHGFNRLEDTEQGAPPLRLIVRANRDRPVFDFLEPVVLELKLYNASDEAVLVDKEILARADAMIVATKRDRQPARQYLPYATYCWKPEQVAIPPKGSKYESLFVAAGKNGWDVAEPGRYVIQLAIQWNGRQIVSNPLQLIIAPPHDAKDEAIAQRLFTDEAGRTLAFDGTRYFSESNDVLQEIVERMPDRPVAVHAAVALAQPMLKSSRELELTEDAQRALKFRTLDPNPEGGKLVSDFLGRKTAIETLGHIDYEYYARRAVDLLGAQEEHTAAVSVWRNALKTMQARKVRGRPIVQSAIDAFQQLGGQPTRIGADVEGDEPVGAGSGRARSRGTTSGK